MNIMNTKVKSTNSESPKSENDDLSAKAVVAVLLLLVFIISLPFVNLRLTSRELTGYIYAKSDFMGRTTYQIRYSQNAGTDEQPSFCSNTNSEVTKSLNRLVGSNQKVHVKINSPTFYYHLNPVHCAVDPTFEMVEKDN